MKFEFKEGKVLIEGKKLDLDIIFIGIFVILCGVLGGVIGLVEVLMGKAKGFADIPSVLLSFGMAAGWVMALRYYINWKTGKDPGEVEKKEEVKGSGLGGGR